MSPNRFLGILLLVVGLIILYFGLRATDSVGESLKDTFTGKYTVKTTWYIAGGAAATILGAMLALFGARTKNP